MTRQDDAGEDHDPTFGPAQAGAGRTRGAQMGARLTRALLISAYDTVFCLMGAILSVTQLTSGEQMVSLLTVETLAFAVFGLSLTFGESRMAKSTGVRAERRIAVAAAAIMSFLAAGAGVAWWYLYVGHWPSAFGSWFPVAMLGLGIVAQPLFAWGVLYALLREPKGGSTVVGRP
jgi:hypothetical protein